MQLYVTAGQDKSYGRDTGKPAPSAAYEAGQAEIRSGFKARTVCALPPREREWRRPVSGLTMANRPIDAGQSRTFGWRTVLGRPTSKRAISGASQTDSNGILLLNRFTGAARELRDALLINPYSPSEVAEAIREAVEMDSIEIRRRMGRMRERVTENNCLQVGGVHLKASIEGGMKSLPHALEAWGEIERRLRRADRVVLFADFDGTLVRIARTPDAARLTLRARRLLSLLAGSGVLVGVASGRRLSDLRKQVGLRRIFYVGSHGYSCYRPGYGAWSALPLRQRSLMTAVHRSLGRRLLGLKGIWLEPKDGPVAVHYRNASRSNAAAAEEAIRQILSEHPRLRLLAGKKVWEVLPEHRLSKWTAMKQILRAASLRGPRLLFYLGDDATDERVFSEMSGISIAIGRRHRTTARYYLRSSGEVLTFLERILETVK